MNKLLALCKKEPYTTLAAVVVVALMAGGASSVVFFLRYLTTISPVIPLVFLGVVLFLGLIFAVHTLIRVWLSWY